MLDLALFDEIRAAFDHACDHAKLEPAAALIQVMEAVLNLGSAGPDPSRRRRTESLVAAGERLRQPTRAHSLASEIGMPDFPRAQMNAAGFADRAATFGRGTPGLAVAAEALHAQAYGVMTATQRMAERAAVHQREVEAVLTQIRRVRSEKAASFAHLGSASA